MTTLSSTFKSQDTEEWLDIHLTRPLGLLWAHLFRLLHVHPNVVTLLSIVLGALAGCFFASAETQSVLLGILSLFVANLLDSADGQLARMTGQKTRLGRVLDGFAGDVWFIAIYAAICLRLQHTAIPFTSTDWGIWIWVLCAFTGFICHGNQCKLADYYRNIHLYFMKGHGGSELEAADSLKAEFKRLRWRDDFIWRLFLYFYARYTAAQESMTPAFQALRRKLAEMFPDGALPEKLREDFRQGSLPLMAYANILTFNTRAIVLYISMLLGQPLYYLAFELTVLNALFFYMRARHESLCRHLYETSSSYSA